MSSTLLMCPESMIPLQNCAGDKKWVINSLRFESGPWAVVSQGLESDGFRIAGYAVAFLDTFQPSLRYHHRKEQRPGWIALRESSVGFGFPPPLKHTKLPVDILCQDEIQLRSKPRSW